MRLKWRTIYDHTTDNLVPFGKQKNTKKWARQQTFTKNSQKLSQKKIIFSNTSTIDSHLSKKIRFFFCENFSNVFKWCLLTEISGQFQK